MKTKFFLGLVCILLAFVIFNPVFSQNSNDYFQKANSLLVAGKFQEAATFYQNAINQKPDFAEAYMGLGIAYKEMGKYNEAEAATLEAIKLKPSYYQAYYNLGLIYEKENKYNEAIGAYEKFLDEVPGAEKFSDAKLRVLRLKKHLAH